MRLTASHGLTAGILTLGFWLHSAQERPVPVGCYYLSPELSYVSRGRLDHADSSWGIIELLPSGKVYRPLLQRRTAFRQMSSWRLVGDTLHVGLSDGYSGWSMALTKPGPGWVGMATYRTDFIDGSEPFRQKVVLAVHSCPGSA